MDIKTFENIRPLNTFIFSEGQGLFFVCNDSKILEEYKDKDKQEDPLLCFNLFEVEEKFFSLLPFLKQEWNILCDMKLPEEKVPESINVQNKSRLIKTIEMDNLKKNLLSITTKKNTLKEHQLCFFFNLLIIYSIRKIQQKGFRQSKKDLFDTVINDKDITQEDIEYSKRRMIELSSLEFFKKFHRFQKNFYMKNSLGDKKDEEKNKKYIFDQDFYNLYFQNIW